MSQRPLLNVKEAAAILSMSTQWLYANAGTLVPCIHLGGALRFDPQDLQDFIEASRSGPLRRRALSGGPRRPTLWKPA